MQEVTLDPTVESWLSQQLEGMVPEEAALARERYVADQGMSSDEVPPRDPYWDWIVNEYEPSPAMHIEWKHARATIAPSARDNDGSACDNAQDSDASNLEPARMGCADNDPRVCDNEELSRCLIRTESTSRGHSSSSEATHRDNERPRGDRSSPDSVLEQRIWVSSIATNPFVSRRQGTVLFDRAFGLKTRTYDRRCREIRAGWHAPFRGVR